MALRVWLPLTGTLENKGTGTITCGGTPSFTTGKIGQGLSLYSRISCNSPSIAGLSTYSIAFWAIVNADSNLSTNWVDVIGFTDQKTDNSATGQLRWETCYASGYENRGISGHDNGTYATTNYSAISGSDPIGTKGVWQHITCTVTPTTMKIYRFGELKATFNSNNGHLTGAFWLGETNKTNGVINDVRIYDHCLSAAEVKEISQGLVLHYKLDSGSLPLNKNIVGTARYGESASSGWGAHRGTSTKVDLDASAQIPWHKGTKLVVTYDTSLGSGGGCGFYLGEFTTASNTTYCYSLYIQAPDDLASLHANWLYRYEYNSSSTQQIETGVAAVARSISLGNHWYRIWGTFTTKTETTKTRFYFYTYPGKNITYYFGCPQVELGSTMTPWNDGNIFTTITDSSGYGHNGTITGTPTLNSNTPRYSSCIQLTSGQKISSDFPIKGSNPIWSINFWLKTYTVTYTQWSDVVTIPGTWQFRMETVNTNGTYVNWFQYPKGTSGGIGNAASQREEWHMHTLVWSNSTVASYRDGVLVNSIAISGDAWTPSGTFSIGDSGMYMYMSDFRIYATALSIDDMKQLYNTAAKVDNLEGLHTFEFQEKGPNKIYKTGITQGQEISEIDGMSNLKYDPNVYIEPDGSAWVRIFHHVNPTSNKFASSDTFTTGVYKDANRWFNFDLCNYVNNWEFIAAVIRTNTDTLERYRWIQSANPLTATFDQTKVANVTRITTGYNTSPLGGLYHVSGSSWLAANNGTNNNWFGATGCWTAWNGGIPGWKSTAAGDAVTTGTIDIYLRIDNITTAMPPIAKSSKNNIWVGHTLIEK